MAANPTRVLLVEDDPADRAWIDELLAAFSEPLDLSSTGSLATACELLRENRYDLILLDLFLEDDAGIDVLVRVFAQTPEVPIVILSAPADEELAAQGVGAGASAYLIKRRDPARAVQLLRETIEQSRHGSRGDKPLLLSRDAFSALAEKYVNVAARAGKRLLLFAGAVGEGKRIEAEHGAGELQHAGDEAAEILRLTFRASDLLARFGVDRFAALAIMHPDDNGAEVVSLRLREMTDAENSRSSRPYYLTLDFQFESVDPDEIAAAEELSARAEQMLRTL